MKKKQMEDIQESLRGIVQEPLRKITRAADLICFQFGSLLKTEMPVCNAEGKLVPGEGYVGEYALQVACYGRMVCGETVIFAKGDLFQPSSEALARLTLGADDALPEDFDYGVIGNNRLDEVISTKFASIEDFIVESVSVNRLGDLRIRFGNGFEFQALIDVSGPEECWRFFTAGADMHVVMTGEGLDIDG